MNSVKFNRFMEELETLCKHHRVQISVSGYDGIEIRDLNNDEYPIYANGIADMTESDKKNNG